jgi:hypothetical protein
MTRTRVVLLIWSLLCTLTTPFQQHSQNALLTRRSLLPPWTTTLRRSSSSSDSSSSDDVGSFEFNASSTNPDAETLLRINFSFNDDNDNNEDGGRLALSAVQQYCQTFPFAAVLPVQPLTYIPLTLSDGNPAVQVSFLRKKTAEKGSIDGGILFTSCLVSEEDCDDEGLTNYKRRIQLTAIRITEGQTVSKMFSEKQILLAFVKGLNDPRGIEILTTTGGRHVEVESIFHRWLNLG